jgi:hypothetical protein
VVDPAENNDEESASGYRVPCSAGATSMYGREYCDKKWFKFRFDCNHVECSDPQERKNLSLSSSE